MNYRNCYNCFCGGDGEEIDDYGYCWLHNGDPEYQQPPKNEGCDSWISNEEVHNA